MKKIATIVSLIALAGALACAAYGFMHVCMWLNGWATNPKLIVVSGIVGLLFYAAHEIANKARIKNERPIYNVETDKATRAQGQ